MRHVLSLFFFVILSATSYSQVSDFITVKKRNNRTIKTYFPGSPISVETIFGDYLSGIVQDVRNDSIIIKQADVRAIPNMWGVSKIDTVATYLIKLSYKDINKVLIPQRESFRFFKNGTIFMIAGIGFATLNVINGKYLDESITSSRNLQSLGIALGVAGTGLLLNRLHKYNNRNGKSYRVEYIHMNPSSRQRAL